MAELGNAAVREPIADDTAEWRPFHVWESQVRAHSHGDRRAPRVEVHSSKESWDPFAVWKRHVRR